jgi:hypothetical protein
VTAPPARRLVRRHALPAACLAGASLSAPGRVAAQEGPFARTTVRLAAVAPVARSAALDRYWRARPGGAMHVELPFHVGHVGATLQRTAYAARAAAQPDFVALQATVGWGGERAIAGPLHAGVGRIARQRALDLRRRAERRRSPRERARRRRRGAAAPRAARGARGRALATLDHVFTSRAIRVGALSAAVGYAFRTPAWLRGALE